MTANTVAQTNRVREAVGGKTQMIERSGSDAPLRFTGAVIRRVAEHASRAYAATERISLSAVLFPQC